MIFSRRSSRLSRLPLGGSNRGTRLNPARSTLAALLLGRLLLFTIPAALVAVYLIAMYGLFERV